MVKKCTGIGILLLGLFQVGVAYAADASSETFVESSISAFKEAQTRPYFEKAEQGDPAAMGWLGLQYFLPNGGLLPHNREEGLRWLTMAVEKDDPSAQTTLGIAFLEGIGVEKDFVKALQYLSSASQAGITGASYALGKMYQNGMGVPKDAKRASVLFALAKERNGFGEKEYGKVIRMWLGKPTADDRAENERIAKEGMRDYGEKIFQEGVAYLKGAGITQDTNKARELILAAAFVGHVKAQALLGAMYRGGWPGVEQNLEESFRWHQKAALQGNRDSIVEIANAYWDGKGVMEDKEMAVYWFRQAAEKGDADSRFNLGVAYAAGLGVSESKSAAADWYYQAGMTYLKEGKRDKALLAVDRINLVSPDHFLGEKLARAIYEGQVPSVEHRKGESQQTQSSGTGWFIVSGQVVTAAHVVGDSKKVNIVAKGGIAIKANVVKIDRANDIAILQLLEKAKVPLGIPLASSKSNPGAKVFTIGFPHPDIMGVDAKVSSGEISGVNGVGGDPRFYQVSVPVQAGNSGGPLLNMNGEAIGILAAKLDAVGMAVLTGDLTENVNYAVKVQYLVPLMEGISRKTGPTLSSSAASLEELTARIRDSVVMVIAE